ncbi:repulsive guidance molecule A-like isoform X2 [Apostichopus japonicus]|uniref:repulsive guidance molecule A-like isoform X2 n=1 Tax=Stichopus japonicus TaxID=307972 RepID=UPI003AB6832B
MGQTQRPRGSVSLPFVWLLAGMVIPSYRRSYLGLTNAALYLQILLIASIIALGRGQCRLKDCSAQYSKESTHLTGQNRQACKAVIRFKDCVDGIDPSTCRGDLTYHSTMTIIPDLMKSYCADTRTVTPEVPTHTTESSMCRWKGTNNFRHCGLFGDPHLRTFDDTFLTCKAAGAWPLVFNEYLAVQVTNVPLTHGQGATATSKLVVIIKENVPCTEKKMYEVRSGSLPNTFIDGSRRSGTVSITTNIPGEHIEIHIKHIATIIIVRQVGKYITFAIRMPEQLIRSRGMNDIQLCVKGCPESERIAYADFLVQTRMEGKSSEGLSVRDNFASIRDNAVSKCRKAGVIDVYLDSCVFDLITTGDSNFTKAAQSALSDMKLLNPEASSLLRNRTSVFEQDNVVWRLIYGNAAPSRTISRSTLFYQLMIVFALTFFIRYL